MRAWIIVLAALAAASAPVPAAAEAAAEGVTAAVDCKVQAIHGLQAEGGIDPALKDKDLRKKLSAGPFAAYKTFRLLQVREAKPASGKPATVKIAGDRVLTLAFHEVARDKGKARLRLSADVPPTLKNMTWKMDDGDVQLLVFDGYQGGILVTAIRCKTAGK